jgi:hypothetical protein
VELSIRGILRGFGLKVGPVTRKGFEARIQELVTGQATLECGLDTQGKIVKETKVASEPEVSQMLGADSTSWLRFIIYRGQPHQCSLRARPITASSRSQPRLTPAEHSA